MLRSSLMVLLLFGFLTAFASADEFELQKTEDGITVNAGGKLLTRYLMKSGAKPVLWPLIGPHGKPITRAYPMKPGNPTEREDHHHHRSFWFTHGDVNGVSFWHEQGQNGTIEHREFVRLEGGKEAVIETRNDWLSNDGTKLCEDQRVLTFGRVGPSTYIDFDITIKAAQDITFGDTKEGSFGVRVAGTMKVDAKQGGRIVNSEGLTDKEAWGKPAAWVDYHGPVEGETVGLAIMNHPSSFRYPTHWHVRTYGLFAANPFGLHDFNKGQGPAGTHAMKKDETFSLRYRVLLHPGDEKVGKVAEVFADYSKTRKGS